MIKFFEKNKKATIAVTILIAILIFLFSSIPGTVAEIIPSTNILSIIYHFSIFFLLNFFLLISMHNGKKLNKDYILLGTITSIFYGILDELHQTFVPFRFPSFGDIIVDMLGIFTALAVYIYFKKKN